MKKKTSQTKPSASVTETSVAEEEINFEPAMLNIKDILVPLDFSSSSKKALAYALPFAKQFGAKITLLYVVEPVVYPAEFGYVPSLLENDQAVAAAKAKLEKFGAEFVGLETLSKTLVRTGSPFREIADAARTLKVDLMIISTHGYTGLKHVLLGSTAERVVRHATCPVLVVREPEFVA